LRVWELGRNWWSDGGFGERGESCDAGGIGCAGDGVVAEERWRVWVARGRVCGAATAEQPAVCAT
jgi:hypothetical protein